MVCEIRIKELERALGRKLTPEEKKKVQERMHHTEQAEIKPEEEMIYA